jgi:hypothetical protein
MDNQYTTFTDCQSKDPQAALHFAPNIPIERIADEWSESGMSYRILGAAKYAPTP